MREPGHAGQASSYGFLVPCCNEIQNIVRLLERLDRTSVDGLRAAGIVVVSDASSDGTDEAVRSFGERSTVPVLLVSNVERRGKCAAINQGLAAMAAIGVIAIVGADVLPEDGCVERLIVRLRDDPRVGVAGGRPSPRGIAGTIAFGVTQVLWATHHHVAMRHPKSAEVTVFRNLGILLDHELMVDEAEIERIIQGHGLQVAYLPEAIIYTQAPLTIGDYCRQRTRVTRGYLQQKRRYGTAMAPLKLSVRRRALLDVVRDRDAPLLMLAVVVVLEAGILFAAWIQHVADGRPCGSWDRIASAKRPFADIVAAPHP